MSTFSGKLPIGNFTHYSKIKKESVVQTLSKKKFIKITLQNLSIFSITLLLHIRHQDNYIYY